MLLRYVLSTILFPICIIAEETTEDFASIGSNITIFLLIVAVLFTSYKTFIFYLSSRKHQKRTKTKRKENHISSTTFNENETLLDEEKDLINFLKLNAQSNKLTNETFRVQNLLNEVYGLLETIIQENNIEFIYDIDSSMPIELVGDSLLLEKTLYLLLCDLLDKIHDTDIIVTFKKLKEPNEITVHIDSHHALSLGDEIEKTLHTLLSLAHSRLTINENTFTIHLPFIQSPVYLEAYYSLPQNIVGQKVLLIEDATLTAQSIQKTLEHFGLKVTIEPTQKLNRIEDYIFYDILIVDAKLLTPIILRHLEKMKNEKNFHIISLEKLYGQPDRRFKPNPLVSRYLYKPLSSGMIYGFLYEIYVMQKNVDVPIVEKATDNKSELIFIEDVEHITRESFQDFNTTNVLLVEDNKINQKIIQSILEKAQVHIIIANNGQEALTYLEEGHKVDIVLMDINMPIMDGYQATKKIRETEALSSLPIIILSTLGFRNDIEQMYIVGANAHLTKPFKIGQLYNAFEMFLKSKKPKEHQNNFYHTSYTEDTNILDIQKGSASAKNILAYRDDLREKLVTYKYSDEKIKENIIKKDFITLSTYTKNILADLQDIGATSLTQILNEMLILINNKEEELLHSYIVLYREEWLKTKRNIELYLKSVNAY